MDNNYDDFSKDMDVLIQEYGHELLLDYVLESFKDELFNRISIMHSAKEIYDYEQLEEEVSGFTY